MSAQPIDICASCPYVAYQAQVNPSEDGEMPQIALAQATIDYRVVGPANSPHPPVVFVHGILVDNRLWDRVADGLARLGFRCFLPNWPLGSHTIPVNDGVRLSPGVVAAMIRDFIEALGLDDVTLVGNNTGGGLCQLVVDAYPDRVGRLVLTNCDAFDKFPPFPFTLVFALLRGPITIKMLFEPMRLRALRHSPLGFGLLMHPDPSLTDSWLEPGRRDARIRRDLATMLRAVAKTDLNDVSMRLARFTKPVTLVWGQRDRAFTPALGRRLAALFPNSTLIEVPGARTFVALDAPAAVIDAIATVGANCTDG
jgi:pimeloyl-ACP methyl ester carboxylesterase